MRLVEFVEKSGEVVVINSDQVKLIRTTWEKRDADTVPEEFTMVVFGGDGEFVIVEGRIADTKKKLLLGTLTA